MNLNEIKSAIANGERVFWQTPTYEVILDSVGQYLIKCHFNGFCIGLTHRDNVTMNCKESDFFSDAELQRDFVKEFENE
jgi:hypothetical protein